MSEDQSEKIQKVLSRYGYGSRREIETWLTAGRIHLNDKVVKYLPEFKGPNEKETKIN